MAFGFFLGAFLGFLNVLFVAFAMAWSDPSIPPWWVVTFGLVPGLVTGAVLGVVAARTTHVSTAGRVLALALPASSVVALLGAAFEMDGYIMLAWIPTVAGCCVLERATRKPPDLAAARVES